MKKFILFYVVLVTLFSCTNELKQQNLANYINPLIGTDSRYELSNGNTYPAIALPWGMNFWTPQTNKMGDGWCYQYSSDKIRGIKQTHQASPWLNDYGAFSLFATTNKLVFNEDKRESWFSHKSETALAYYYSVYLADYNTTIEVTPTQRAASFRFTFPKTDSAFVVIDGFNNGSYIEVSPDNQSISGYVCNNHGGVPENFKNYFIIHLDKQFEEIFSVEDALPISGKNFSVGDHAGVILRFKTGVKEKINLTVASSFISPDQAALNLDREIGNKTFEEVKAEAKNNWNTQLNRVKLKGGTEGQYITFYTALYRTMLFPRTFYEYDKENKAVHYSPYNGKVLDGYMFTDNGFWDTFRAVFPWFNLMFREQNSKIISGLVNTYLESGWLPEWASPGHRDVMIGSNSASIIADAYLKGIDIPEINTLFEAILKNSEKEGPMHSVGRYGVNYYNKLGYIPYNVGINENAARTLEYAYDDFTIWRLANSLKRPDEEIKRFLTRSMNYRNVFDPSINFMRGKNEDGNFQIPFRPDKWGDAFTEGCSWHWTWCVFHDIQGLIKLMGGKEKFTEKLDSVFLTPPTADYSYYGFQIHEITEMKIINMGQYAHGNQPVQHMPYLYTYAGQPWKTQYHVRTLMNSLYKAGPDGLCGDEDNGQTSAWYVFSALGMYPLTPGSNQYVLGSPLFKKATLYFENGKSFCIEASNNSDKNFYIKNCTLNHKKYTRNYLIHDDLMKGGLIKFNMSIEPNTIRGRLKQDAPYSLSPPEL